MSYTEQTDLSLPASATPSGQVTYLPAVQATNGILLNWAAPAGAVSFNIYRGPSQGQEDQEIYDSCTAASCTDTGAAQGIAYWYYVTAVDAYGDEGDPSNEASAAWVAPPSGLSDIPGSTGVLFTWAAQTGVQSHNIYRV